MEHAKPTLRNLFSESSTYAIPVFQREYEWDISRWQELWADVMVIYRDALESETTRKHFLGILLFEESPANPTQKFIVDGQQRLVTLLALLAAIGHHKAALGGIQTKTRDRIVFPRADTDEQEEIGPRIQVQRADRDAFMRVLNDQWRLAYQSITSKQQLASGIESAYIFFRFMLYWGADSITVAQQETVVPKYSPLQQKHELSAEQVWAEALADTQDTPGQIDTLVLLRVVLDQISFVSLTVEPGDQDAQTIFSSINAKRTSFDQWDFVRNDVFLPLRDVEANSFHDNEWSGMQESLRTSRYQSQRGDSRDIFLYDYLIARGESGQPRQGTIGRNRGASHFRRRKLRVLGADANSAESMLAFVRNDLMPAAEAWPYAIGGRASDSYPREATYMAEVIMSLAAGPATPVVLRLTEEYLTTRLSKSQLLAGLELVMVFLGRHVLYGTSMSPLRSFIMKTMAALATSTRQPQGQVDPHHLRKLLFPPPGAHFSSPSDAELRKALKERDFYGPSSSVRSGQLVGVFRALEVRKSGIGVGRIAAGKADHEYSVEHVAPQSLLNRKSAARGWGPSVKSWGVNGTSYTPVMHTLGNLALMTNAMNKWCSDRPLDEKRKALTDAGKGSRGKKAWPEMPVLRVNEFLMSADSWTPSDIQKRTNALAREIVNMWKIPVI